ncbi:helix-turn-helix domain-containing protein [Streptomyces sp. 1331.2]|uniref:helix-turn-helix domain-containing protein n=1 Tax=Streptomyces sp. 1331.2 TaxID=1938835 RepID=UPI000BD7165B|nr:helix-turn-helix domain-containing protein [Streptomyces sp. 1331.2]SOB81546.1 GAF domain-containing protein [Streptomyces sp. 1331.2]
MRQTGRQSRRPERRTPPTAAELAKVHERTLADAAAREFAGPASPEDVGAPGLLRPRPEIDDSWARLRRLGLDPDTGAATVLLGPGEIEQRRRTSGLDAIMPVLRETLLEPTGALPLILAIADAEGHVLWQEGERGLRRSADRIGFITGARWTEESVGTNGIAVALRAQRPMHVHSAEHYLRSHHSWTCVAAPVHDPGTGQLVGAVNLSGPAHSIRPYLLQLTATAARLAETELRAHRLEALHQLRTLAAPVLARVGGPALVVDAAGWTAAAAGLPPPNRLRVPSEGWAPAAVHWVPGLGECVLEPLADGWLVRPVRPPGEDGSGAVTAEQVEGARLRLDLRRPDRPELSVRGAVGSWSHPLSPRHAELLLLLATGREGRTAAQLAEALFGDAGRTVTVRAELSRLRRYLGGLLAHRPYRIAESVLVTVDAPDDPYDLLPASSAPAVRRLRAALAAGTARLPGAAPPVPAPRTPGDSPLGC